MPRSPRKQNDQDLLQFMESETVKRIFHWWKTDGDSKQRLPKSLGASFLGKPCDRSLWYHFRHACRPRFEGRLYRLFETGTIEEARLAADLVSIGCTVHVSDPSTGKQFRIQDLGGHVVGYLDGCALNIPEAPKTWHVLEFKTHNAKNFRALKSKSVKVVKPDHYAPMMIYMHKTGMTRALYLACNKDTDELHAERIRYDKTEAEAYIARAKKIIFSSEVPDRIGNGPDYYLCHFCDARYLCHDLPREADVALRVPQLSCRQCCFSEAIPDGCDGQWVCKLQQRGLSYDDQLAPCDNHLVLPGLLPNCEPLRYVQANEQAVGTFTNPSNGDRVDRPIDSSQGPSLEYRHSEYGTFWQGRGQGMFSSRDLMHVSWATLFNTVIQRVKEVFAQSSVVAREETLLTKFDDEHSEVQWKGRATQVAQAWGDLYGQTMQAHDAVNTTIQPTYSITEFSEGRGVIIDLVDKSAEIRQLKKRDTHAQTTEVPDVSTASHETGNVH